MNAYLDKYQQNQIYTATPEQILIMLYDGAIRFIRQAMMAEEQGNLAYKLERISKTMAIIIEFSNTLDHKIGGQIAEDLDGLYQFMIRELNGARKDTTGKKLKTVEGLLVDLRDTWSQAVDINRQEQEKTSSAPQMQQSTQPEKTYAPINASGYAAPQMQQSTQPEKTYAPINASGYAAPQKQQSTQPRPAYVPLNAAG